MARKSKHRHADATVAKLQVALDSTVWDHCRIIADRLEELGEDALAWAYRDLADNQRLPTRSTSKMTFCWPGHSRRRFKTLGEALHWKALEHVELVAARRKRDKEMQDRKDIEGRHEAKLLEGMPRWSQMPPE